MMKTIKKYLPELVAVLAVLLVPGANANDGDFRAGMVQSDAQEQLDYIKVTPVNEFVDSNDVMHGKAQALFQFWVEASVAELNLYCLVTDMQRDQGQQAEEEDVISLDQAYGCRIAPVDAVSYAGEDSATLKFDNKKTFLEGRDAIKSEYATFRTDAGEKFRQNIYVKLLWDRNNRALPVGQYRAAVRLVAELPSPLNPPK